MRSRQRVAGVLFAAPFLVLFLAVLVAPLVYAAWLSLFREQLIGGTRFVGLGNYLRAATDPRLHQGLSTVAQFFLIQVPVMLGLALVLALALDGGLLRWARTIRLGIYLPHAVPTVVATLMWGYLYGPDVGLLTQLGRRLGTGAPQLLTESAILPALANVVTWEYTGYNMLILYTALRAVPRQLAEAAAIDGAGPVRLAWSVKLPLIRPALLLALVFSLIGSSQLFTEPRLLQPVAPTAIGSDFTPSMYAFSLAFTGQDLTYAATVSFLLGLVVTAVSGTIALVARRGDR